MKYLFDLMGVLFYPSRVIYNGFYRELKDSFSYEVLKEAYKKATIGDAYELNNLISIEEQKKILLKVVKPTINFERLKELDNIYILSNMPALWGTWLINKYLEGYVSGTFISGFMGLKKPQIEIFNIVKNILGEEILFLDDKKENIESARLAGYKTILVEDPNKILELIHHKTL